MWEKSEFFWSALPTACNVKDKAGKLLAQLLPLPRLKPLVDAQQSKIDQRPWQPKQRAATAQRAPRRWAAPGIAQHQGGWQQPENQNEHDQEKIRQMQAKHRMLLR
jgi:hypothetical protein